MTVPERNPVRELRLKNKLTQVELATLAGCSQSLVSKLEKPPIGGLPENKNIAGLARALKVSPQDFRALLRSIQLSPGEDVPGEEWPAEGVRHVARDAAVSMRPELRNHALWPELEAGARAKAAEMGRTFPEWAWDATARARLVITGDPDVTGVFDLVKMHFERGWGRPRDERAETGAVPKAKGEKP